jgi:1-aminocyclopropane-1-carboxylate deaminase/D-cysteine desulfhydrase-like pyridoxal-dependent ACC family enzyme
MTELEKILDSLNEITPIQEDGGILYKRDDLFKPFDVHVSGGKLRQCVALFDLAKEDIAKCDVVITPTSVSSPQGMIVSYLANLIGKKSMLVVGNSSKDPADIAKRNVVIEHCMNVGAEIRIVSGLGFNNVLHSKAYEIAKEENGFVVAFGINSETYGKAIIGSTGLQTANIPRDLDNLIIPCGSGLTTAGILKAIETWPAKERPKNIYVLQIAGYDRVAEIEKELPFIHNLKYNFVKYNEFKYSQHVHETSMGGSFVLDCVYEGKAHYWMRNILKPEGKTLFWVIGETNKIR